MFAIVNDLLLRPVGGVRDPDQLFRIIAFPAGADNAARARSGMALAEFTFLRDGLGDRLPLVATAARDVELTIGESAERLSIQLVSLNFFDVLGVRAVRGNVFREDLARDGALPPPVIVLSRRYWERAAGGDDAIIGRPVRLNGISYIVIGVADGSFAGLDRVAPAGWIPAQRIVDLGTEPTALQSRHFIWLTVFGRRPPRLSLDGATAMIATVRQRDLEGATQLASRGLSPARLVAAEVADAPTRDIVAPTKIAVWLLQLSMLLLAIACINAGVLLVARGYARRDEVATKLTLGASPTSIVRELIAESGVVALVATVVGLLLAWGSLNVYQRVADIAVPIADWRVLGFAAFITAIICVSAALLPTIDLFARFRAGGAAMLRSATTTIRSRPLRAVMSAQFGLAFVLVAVTGLLLETVYRATRLGLGVDTDELTIVSVSWSRDPRANEFIAAAADRLSGTSGIAAVALSAAAPLYGSVMRPFQPPESSPQSPSIEIGGNIISPSYFTTVGMRVLSGRSFTDSDREGAEQVVIVNQTMARMYWPGADPIGRCLYGPQELPGRCSLRVVGVVNDTKLAQVTEPARPYVFTPIEQSARVPLLLNVRTRGAATGRVTSIRAAMAGLAPPSAIEIQPVSSLIATQTAPWRRAASTLSVFAVLALGFAAFGLYSVTELLIAARRRELAIRMAVGATASGIIRSLAGERMLDTAIGAALGLGLLLLILGHLSRAVQLLASSPLWIALFAAVVLAVVAIVATMMASRRISRLNPATILQSR
jgi:predicted permease